MFDGGARPVIASGPTAADTWRRTEGGVSRAVTVGPSWLSWGKVHTGAVAALGLQTMSAALGVPRTPRSISTTFLRPVADETPLELAAALERVGSTSSVVSLRAKQADDSVFVATATFGVPKAVATYAGPDMPVVPPPDSCPALPHALAPFTQHLEMRAATDDRCLGNGPRAQMTSWMRFVDGRTIDAPGLAILLDGHAPGLYATLSTPLPMPLREYVVEFADDVGELPSIPWVLVRVRMTHAGGGWVYDETMAWSEGGQFLACARQHREILTREPEAGTTSTD